MPLSAQEKRSDLQNIQDKIAQLSNEVPGLNETLNITISQTSLSNFLLAISEIHSLNFNVSPELGSISIINNFSDVVVSDVLIFLVKEYNIDIDFTGNILSFKKYIPPPIEEAKKEIKVSFDPASKNIILDLKSNRLSDVFRKIMDLSGRNLLFSPEIANKPLSIYLNDVPFDLAMEKLAISNDLILEKSRDGFYTFRPSLEVATGENTSKVRRGQPGGSNFFYQIVDTTKRVVDVDFTNVNVSDVIYAISDDLNLDVFTATPLDDAGLVSVSAENIEFDLLLDKIFQSAEPSSTQSNNNRNNQGTTRAQFTYKKEGNVYYFGLEDQLSLKQVERIWMMHRSVQLLENPSGGGQRRAGRNFFNTNPTNFYSSFPQTNTRNTGSTSQGLSQEESNLRDITDIIPDEILEGIDVKIDVELNSFIVNGPGVKVERFKKFVKTIDQPVPVILIEVMILEVNRSAITETGISFGIGDRPRETRGEFFPSGNVSIGAQDVNKIIGNFNGFGSLNIGQVVPNFYLDIKAMESAGILKIQSTPQLSTLNGHKAFLASGETTYYAVTSQSFFGSQIPQTSEIRNYVPIDAELSLTILPFVSGDGQITLDIQVLQSAFNGDRIAEDAPPGITSREFSSILKMDDQDVAILGGIESVRKDNSGSGVPFLARIPIIKWLFSKRRREATKRTLNVLIRPTIID
tara:strand:+ start:8413 stop:10482 length:2070 start_codon:yes stop_codon:yes gene_type:complete